MKDAVSLIGKFIKIGDEVLEITNVYFVPLAVSPKHSIYFGLKQPGKGTVNYSYESILPYLNQQIKL